MQDSLSSPEVRFIFEYRTKLQDIFNGLDMKVIKRAFFQKFQFFVAQKSKR